MQLSGPLVKRGSPGGICQESGTRRLRTDSLAESTRHSLGWRSGTDRNGDAGLRLLAALFTVHPVAEGADAGGERGEGQVVVVPLPEQGHHVSELRVVDHAFVGRAEDVVGHLPHLRKDSSGFLFDLRIELQRPAALLSGAVPAGAGSC